MVAISSHANEQTSMVQTACSSNQVQVVSQISMYIDFGALTNLGVLAITGGSLVI